MGYLKLKPYLQKNSCSTTEPIACGGGDKGIYNFPKDISPKMIVIYLSGDRTHLLRYSSPAL